MNIIKCKKPKTKSAITFDVITIAFSVVAVSLFSAAASVGADAKAFSVGEFAAYDISGGFSGVILLLLFCLL